MSNPVGWFEIYVQDMSRAKAFYEAVFDVTLEDAQMPVDMWMFPMDHQAVGAPGALVQMEGMPSGGNSTVIYFSCEDCATEQARTTAHGGSVFKEKFSIGEHGFIAIVKDTEGNMIGLHSMK